MGVSLDKDYTHKLLGCAYTVHSALGPGLLESVYEAALAHELQLQGFEVKHQVPVSVKYRDVVLDVDLRLDIVVDNSVILELKSVSEILPIHAKQFLTYIRLTSKILDNTTKFNEYSLKDGIERVVNNF